jgi:(5-formylfuran-3-yl)methyl phosphate synthase
MQLLISVADAAEARAALAGGATIIDVKNPAEGALGAAPVAALRDVAAVLPSAVPLSAALGETGAQAGQLVLAAYAAASLGAQYVKIGLRTNSQPEALGVLRAVRDGATRANPACRIVAVGYADAAQVGALPWQSLPDLAREAGATGCLIDTALKNGRGLFSHCSPDALTAWLAACREHGLLAALAGTLTLADLPALRRLAPPIVGFRSAACQGDRVGGRVDAELVAALRAGVR